MLNKRVHILFDEKDYVSLVKIAKGEDLSVGELVRKAVKGKYLTGRETDLEARKKLWNEVMELRKQIGVMKGSIDYKELINDGRKW